MTPTATHPAPHHAHSIERSVVRKILLYLVPFIAVQYMFCILDRGNVAIAALQMKPALHMSDRVYGLGAGIFFIGYFLFEVPSNLLMERVGARWWIARIMTTWGVVSSAMMFVHSPASFYTLRFLLGVAEAGFYPGIILYFTYWIPSHLRAQVIARFLAISGIVGLVGAPLGSVLLGLNGKMGLAGWQWLFLMEGVPSILLGFVVFKFLPNGPKDAKWLDDEEKEWIAGRLAEEAKQSDCVQHMSFRVALTDPRIIHVVLIFIITSTAGNAIGFFGPELVKFRSGGLWSDGRVALLTGIPAVVGAIAMALAASHSDRTGRRSYHISLGYLLAGLAFIALQSTPTAPLTLFAMSLNTLGERVAAGSYWAVTTNLMGARAAAGGIAFINSVGNLGGFIGPFLMGELKQRSGGGYSAGLYTAAALFILAAILSAFLKREPRSTAATDPVLAGGLAAAAQPEDV
jgi:ACS family tartrate transporter-like MFS transporter